MNLVQASRNGNLAAVQCLLAAGADDDEALRWASQYGHTAVVQRLLAAGANVHADADLVLRWASENGHAVVVECLLAAGADVHARNDRAISVAAMHGYVDVVRCLLDAYMDRFGWDHLPPFARTTITDVCSKTPVLWCIVRPGSSSLPAAAQTVRRRWYRKLLAWYAQTSQKVWRPPLGQCRPSANASVDAWVAMAGPAWQRAWLTKDHTLVQLTSVE